MAIFKVEPTNSTVADVNTGKLEDGLFHEDGRVFHENLKHVEFEELPKLANGIRLLAMNDSDVYTQSSDLYKLRICDPVSELVLLSVKILIILNF